MTHTLRHNWLVLLAIGVLLGCTVASFTGGPAGRHDPSRIPADRYAGRCYPQLPIRVMVTELGPGNCAKAN